MILLNPIKYSSQQIHDTLAHYFNEFLVSNGSNHRVYEYILNKDDRIEIVTSPTAMLIFTVAIGFGEIEVIPNSDDSYAKEELRAFLKKYLKMTDNNLTA